MSKLLRYFEPGKYCFITAVTANRQQILVHNSRLLIRAVRKAENKSRFTVIAWVIVPDHFHAIIESPDGDISKIVQRVKLSFSLQLKSLSRNTGSVWQHRFWDHIIRSEQDLMHHINYIHFNPVKHGLVDLPKTWKLSSFHRCCRTDSGGGFEDGPALQELKQIRITSQREVFGE